MIFDQAIAEQPEGGYKVIVADVPWCFKTRSAKGLSGRPQHYRRMPLSEIKGLPVRELAAKDCHLFFWTSAPYLEQTFQVIKCWGFKYSSIAFTWIKLWPKEASALFMLEDSFCLGQGYTTRKNSEICLLAKIGHPKRNSGNIRELIFSPRRQHSRKPAESFKRIEQYADGPYLDLFSREKRPGWASFGDEVGKFEEAV